MASSTTRYHANNDTQYQDNKQYQKTASEQGNFVRYSQQTNPQAKHAVSRMVTFLKKMLGKAGAQHDRSLLGYIILLLIFFGYLLGYRTGLVSQIVAFVGCMVFIPMMEYVKPPIEDGIKYLTSSQELSLTVSTAVTLLVLAVFCFIQVILHKILSFLLKITMMGPFNRFMGGLLGLVQVCIMLGTCLILLEGCGVSLPNDTPFDETLRFIADKVFGKQEILSWLQ